LNEAIELFLAVAVIGLVALYYLLALFSNLAT
jgi:hypothetical protein